MSLLPIFKLDDPKFRSFLRRRPAFNAEASALVARILQDVEDRREEAVLEIVRTYDAPVLNDLWVTAQELEEAKVSPEHWAAMRHAIERIEEFHETQLGVITEGWEELDLGWGWRTTAVEHELEAKAPTMEIGPFKIPMPDQAPQEASEGSGMLGQRLIPIH